MQDGDEVKIGGKMWRVHISDEKEDRRSDAGAQYPFIILENAEFKNDREEQRRKRLKTKKVEITKRTEDVAALTDDLNSVTYRCGEVRTHSFPSIVVCVAYINNIITALLYSIFAERRP